MRSGLRDVLINRLPWKNPDSVWEWTRAIFVESKCVHHYANPSPINSNCLSHVHQSNFFNLIVGWIHFDSFEGSRRYSKSNSLIFTWIIFEPTTPDSFTILRIWSIWSQWRWMPWSLSLKKYSLSFVAKDGISSPRCLSLHTLKSTSNLPCSSCCIFPNDFR